MDLANFLIQLLNSVQYGLLLFLLAAGLTLIFGIMGVVNLAHGSFYMLGAYLAYALTGMWGNLFLAVIDSPRGKWTMSKAHNPVQDIYLRVVKGKENVVLGVAAKAVSDSGAGCKLG